jgi:hypothetical protein
MPVKQDILIMINIQEKFGSREISIPLELQNVDDIWILRKLLEEKDKQIESLNKRLEDTRNIAIRANEQIEKLVAQLANVQNTLDSRTPMVIQHNKTEEQEFKSDWQGVIKQPQKIDLCNTNLPTGKWLVQYRYEVHTYGPSQAWIPFTICYGETLLINSGDNHDFGGKRSAGCSGELMKKRLHYFNFKW